MLTALQYQDQLLEQATDLIGAVAAEQDLVAAHDHADRRKGPLDLAHELVTGPDQGRHQMRAGHHDCHGCSRDAHSPGLVVMSTVYGTSESKCPPRPY